MSTINANNELIPIVKRNGITISGKIIGPGARLGQFEVRSKLERGGPYALFSEAEAKMDSIEYILRQEQARAEGKAPIKDDKRRPIHKVFNKR